MKNKKNRLNITSCLNAGIDPQVVEIVFGKKIDSALESELPYSIRVDQAHIIMLLDQKIIPHEYGVKLLKKINSLQRSDFSSLKGKQAGRGWYLLYENELIKTLGSSIGGSLHTGRSRNDLYATVFRLKLRSPLIQTVNLALNLRYSLLNSSKKYRSRIMPIHTQMQPALPTTLGHYLLAVDQCLSRDIQSLINALDEIEYSPLGAGAAGGTSIAINPKRTAELLGFIAPQNNSIDSVASYNYILRILSALSIMSVTISRLATDLHNWTTKEFDFFELSGRLTGSSSMMPQKANPFVIEHVKGISSSNIGYLVSATAAMQKVPFSNAIEVKKEGAKFIWPAIYETTDALKLLDIVINGLTPRQDIMSKHKDYAFTATTALTEILVRKNLYSFREAHQLVVEIIKYAISSNKTFQDIAEEKLKNILGKEEIVRTLDFSNIVKNLAYGGGPGGDSFTTIYNDSKNIHEGQIILIKEKEKRWASAEKKLSNLVTKYIKS